MFIQIYTFFVAVLLAAQINAVPNQNVISKKAINPYDLEDEVREQLEDVKVTVRGAIYAAFDTLDDHVTDVYRFRDDSMNTAELAIQQEYETLEGQVTTIKDLAESANKNIGICLENNEPLLTQLPQTLIDSLMECLAYSNRGVTDINNDASYRVDTLINEVNIFDFQLDLCAGDLFCIEPLVEKIELARVQVPQKIGVELDAAVELFESLKVLVKQCCDDKASQFSAEGSNILADITSCANTIL